MDSPRLFFVSIRKRPLPIQKQQRRPEIDGQEKQLLHAVGRVLRRIEQSYEQRYAPRPRFRHLTCRFFIHVHEFTMSQPIHLGNPERRITVDRVLRSLAYGVKETVMSACYLLAVFSYFSWLFGYLDHAIYTVWLFTENLQSLWGIGS